MTLAAKEKLLKDSQKTLNEIYDMLYSAKSISCKAPEWKVY